MKLSILIKAYNEEANIEATIRSCLHEARGLDFEVVLADSCSTDQTVIIAQRYPISIVSFANANERGCGAGAQLAFQHSSGEYVFLIDGDMVLRPGFIVEALDFLQCHEDVAGVGGIINDISVGNLEIDHRRQREADMYRAGEVVKLDCGGMYRRSAINAVGYFSDRNLHSYEELDLGLRLRVNGGKLHRLGTVSVDHHHRQLGSYELLWRRITSGYSNGAGEVFHAAIGRPHFLELIRELKVLRVVLFIMAWIFITIYSVLLSENMYATFVILTPMAVMSLKKRSLAGGLFSILSWFVYSAGFFRGLLMLRRDPAEKITSLLISKANISVSQK